MPDLDGPAPPSPLPRALDAATLHGLANALQQRPAAEMLPPLDLPIRLRMNGNSPYLLITTEIRRHLDVRGVDFRLTCRSDYDNGMVTWDLHLGPAMNRDIISLLDWLDPVYAIED